MSLGPFAHFEGRRKRPDEYEEVSAYMQWGETFRGVYPDLPYGGTWYHFPERYGFGYWDPKFTALRCVGWEEFRDPNKLTYKSYHAVQSEREQALEAVLMGARASGAVGRLDAKWVDILRSFFPALRFSEWGVSIMHQYVARFSISGLIANCSVLQVFDELRHTQRIAEWTRELESAHGGFSGYRAQWMEDKLFQPLREVTERLLALRDWAEVTVAANVLLEPLLQPVLFRALSDLGTAYGDLVLPHFAYSLHLDEERHFAWGGEFARFVLEHQDEGAETRNHEIMQGWVERWLPLVQRATQPFEQVFADAGQADVFAQAYSQAEDGVVEALEELGLLSWQRA